MKIDFKRKRIIRRDGSWMTYTVGHRKKVLFTSKKDLLDSNDLLRNMNNEVNTMAGLVKDYKSHVVDLQKIIDEYYIFPKYGKHGRLIIQTMYDLKLKNYFIMFDDRSTIDLKSVKLDESFEEEKETPQQNKNN